MHVVGTELLRQRPQAIRAASGGDDAPAGFRESTDGCRSNLLPNPGIPGTRGDCRTLLARAVEGSNPALRAVWLATAKSSTQRFAR